MRQTTPTETLPKLALAQSDSEGIQVASDQIEKEKKIEIPMPDQRFNKWV
jgi:hypothetical protein